MIASIFLIITLLIVMIYGLKLFINNSNLGLFLIIISLLCILVILFPEIGKILSNFFGVARGTDLLLFFSFIIGIIFAIIIHVKIKHLDKLITDLSRHIAITDAKNDR